MTAKCGTVALLLFFLAGAWSLAEERALVVGELNEIVEIYVGERLPNGRTEVVFALKTMQFYSNQSNYGCIFVNGRIVQIREYNNEDSYVRGEVELPADGELIAYCGVISSKKGVDAHDHAALWRAFVSSPHKPFSAKVADRPKWWVSNPIREKRKDAKPSVDPPPLSERIIRSYPYLKREEMPEAIQLAMAPTTGQKARFYAVWGLAISGYTPEGAKALAWVACNRELQEGERGYAAMGLSNFTGAMPAQEREAIREQLRKLLADEGADMPHGIIRTLIAWGDAAYIHETLSGRLKGHPMEIEVLEALPSREAALARLLQLLETCPARTKDERHNWRARVGSALVRQKDKRGIDILLSLLAKEEAPGPQYRNNTFQFLANTLGQSFGYPKGNYRPELEEAIPKMVAWWEEHRDTFEFK